MSIHLPCSTGLAVDDWQFEDKAFVYLPWDLTTPSENEGMSCIEERKVRSFFTGLIQEAGILLKLPQICILTGMMIFNRFYYKSSFQKEDPLEVACASLFLATKVEESNRRVRDIVSVFFHLTKKKEHLKPIPVLEITSETYTNMKNAVIHYEMQILKELGFQIYSLNEHPHKLLKSINLLLKGNPTLVQKVIAELKKAWNYLNDSFRSIACVCFKPNVLASAAIYLAGDY